VGRGKAGSYKGNYGLFQADIEEQQRDDPAFSELQSAENTLMLE
jgi:hypothetical protein